MEVDYIMNCLNCGTEMTNYFIQTKKGQISYDICEACGSLWLDKNELDKMAFQVEGSIEFCSTGASAKNQGSIKNCPRCEEEKLDKVNFIGSDDIILDRCKNCGGFWLDSDELNLIDKKLKKIMPVSGKGFSEFINDVHIPYWFKKIKRKSSETDFKFEVPPLKGAKQIGDADITCPTCNSKMNLYKAFKIQIEGCPNCKGIFLDKDELRKLKDKVEKDSWHNLRWMDDEIESIDQLKLISSQKKCPKCSDAEFLTVSFGNSKIFIDWCKNCKGIWLDKDEFFDITKYLIKVLNELSSGEMKKKMYEEIKEIWDGPENAFSEILDAKAAISALINITIFEHPKLAKKLLSFPRF